MHHAPAVSFPLGRSRFLGRLLTVAWAVGAGVVMLWVGAQRRWGWPLGIGTVAVALCGILVRGWWSSHLVGDLAWNGQEWQVRLRGTTITGQVSVHLDFQRHLLLKLTCGRRMAPIWLWLDEQSDAPVWRDVRRAVYSRAKTPSDTDRVPGSVPP